MNKRMREPFHTIMWKASIGYNDSWSQVDPAVLEKFAELIVWECIEVVRDIRQDYDGGSTTVVASDEIKQHFGLDVL